MKENCNGLIENIEIVLKCFGSNIILANKLIALGYNKKIESKPSKSYNEYYIYLSQMDSVAKYFIHLSYGNKFCINFSNEQFEHLFINDDF